MLAKVEPDAGTSYGPIILCVLCAGFVYLVTPKNLKFKIEHKNTTIMFMKLQFGNILLNAA